MVMLGLKQKETLTLDALCAEALRHNPAADISLIQRAYRFAEAAHKGQFRQSGHFYIIHPLSVAMILARLQMDEVTIAAALLHDVLEDTPVVARQVLDTFQNEELLFLVESVTKASASTLAFENSKIDKAEDFRKLFLAMASDVRVVLIKLADRLHNMQTLGAKGDEEKIRRIADETLYIYAPLANRLGVYQLKWQLEDLSFKHLDPKAYATLANKLDGRRQDRENEINAVVQELKALLDAHSFPVILNGRPKHLYSIYSKMEKDGLSFEEIYDLAAVRVIVEDRPQCYTAMGLIHGAYQHVQGRLKDYIAMPKSNQYQSIHTTLLGLKARPGPVEVQIRTKEMHRVAELGVASHWAYKEDNHTPDKDVFHRQYSLLRQVFDYTQKPEGQTSAQFLDVLKSEWVTDEVMVFTPKNDVITLGLGASVLDFAYRIHTEVGHQAVGAKVNGRIVPLNHTLNTGDIIEILTDRRSPGPKRDWLDFIKLPSTRAKVRAFLRKDARLIHRENGLTALKDEARKMGLPLAHLKEMPPPLLRKFGATNMDELYELVGNHGAAPETVLRALKQELAPPTPATQAAQPAATSRAAASTDPVLIEGQPGLPYRMAACCKPMPGHPIVAYISGKRGLMVHSQTCRYISGKDFKTDHFLGPTWPEDAKTATPVIILVSIEDRIGMLGSVLQEVGSQHINVLDIKGRSDGLGHAGFRITIDLPNRQHFAPLKTALLTVPGVLSVKEDDKPLAKN